MKNIKKTFGQIGKNIKIVLTRRNYILFTLLGLLIFLYLWFHFFDYKLSIGNLWYFRTYTDIVSHILISILFSLFLAGQIYKMRHVGRINFKTTWWGVFWSMFGIIITGCPSCSITLVSYLWLTGFLSFFPWWWLELKVLSLILLIIVNYRLYRDLLVCKMKVSKK